MEESIRLSDSEREAAAADLGEHYAQGRLSVEEHAQRLDQIWAARTRGEIAPIFKDLPSPYAAAARAPSTRTVQDGYWRSGLRPFRRGVPTPLVVVMAVLIGLTILSHLPFLLIGIAVFWFVMLRHRAWHRRRGWRY